MSRVARNRCNVSSVPAVFLTRAFMTEDNKSNAGRKENRDVVLYRTLVRARYGRGAVTRLMTSIVSTFSAAFAFIA